MFGRIAGRLGPSAGRGTKIAGGGVALHFGLFATLSITLYKQWVTSILDRNCLYLAEQSNGKITERQVYSAGGGGLKCTYHFGIHEQAHVH